MERFCVRCGRQTGELIGGLCAECYLEKNPVLEVPEKIVLDYDYRSGRLRQGREWLDKSMDLVERIVKDAVIRAAAPKRMDPENLKVYLEPHEDNINAVVSFDVALEGVKVRVKKKINLILRKTISDASSKLSSNYFEATIQVRFTANPSNMDMERRLEEVLSGLKAEKKRNELSQATAIRKVRKGIDVVVGSFKAADKVTRNIARKHHLRVIYSNSLFGIDTSGKNKYRHTYCLKFPV